MTKETFFKMCQNDKNETLMDSLRFFAFNLIYFYTIKFKIRKKIESKTIKYKQTYLLWNFF